MKSNNYKTDLSVIVFASGTMMRRIALSMFAIIIAFCGVMSEAEATPPNPPPDCPGTPFMGPLQRTIDMQGCHITYTYWWRLACGIYYDAYIESYEVEGDCVTEGTFDPVQYNTIIDACVADLVGGAGNPWGAEIPVCDADGDGKYQWSDSYWKFYKPSCMSDYFSFWRDGRLYKKTVPCQPEDQLGYCYNTYRYCWLELIDENGQAYFELQNEVTGGGAFGRLNCPGSIVLQPAPGSDYITVNCNVICDE